MRILITNISFYPAQEGGPTNALYWLASGLSHIGYEVRVVTTHRGIRISDFVYDSWRELNGFSVIYVKSDNWKRILKRELVESDVFITCGVCTIWGFYIRLRAIRLGIKTIISPRGELFDVAINHKGKFYGWMKRVFFMITRLLYNDRAIFHVTSKEEDTAVRAIMKTDRVFMVPNYMILPDRVQAFAGNEDYFLYVGRINPIKALDKLITALAKSERFMNSDLKLKIAGEASGDYYIALTRLINQLELNDRIEFLGVVTGRCLDLLYANAKWLFLLSDSENFGNVVIEGLCQSTPVVASKGTPWSILEDYRAGFWIDNSPSIVSAIIDRVLELDITEYQKFRDNAFQLSRIYDVYNNMEEWKRIIES